MSNLPFGFIPPEPGDDSDPSEGPTPSFSMSDLGSALSQLGAMLQGMGQGTDPGPIDWRAAEEVARRTIAADGDPVVGQAASRETEQAVRLAELWLDPITTFPTTGAGSRAWSRSEWLAATLPAWREIITPIAAQVQASMTSMLPGTSELAAGLPEELRALLPADLPEDFTAMLGPLLGVARQMGAGMFAMQAGQGLAALAGDVIGAADVGLPLTADHVPTLLEHNVAKFGDGLGIDQGEVRLYLALREVAAQRLFANVGWLGQAMRGAVAEYARGIGLDAAAMREALPGLDLNDLAGIQEALASGVLGPKDTPEQKAALARLETLLALTEGWVDHVVTSAVSSRLSDAGRLQEAIRRRRASGGPAERTFATLVGLELRPRRLREAAALWAELERVRGVEGRDAVWQHPDLLPGPDDLDDPAGFVAGPSISDADLAALAGSGTDVASTAADGAPGSLGDSQQEANPDAGGPEAGGSDAAATGDSASATQDEEGDGGSVSEAEPR